MMVKLFLFNMGVKSLNLETSSYGGQVAWINHALGHFMTLFSSKVCMLTHNNYMLKSVFQSIAKNLFLVQVHRWKQTLLKLGKQEFS